MTSQSFHSGNYYKIPHFLKYQLEKKMDRYRRTYSIIEFYSRGLKLHLFALVILSILLGLMETFQIIILYPIISASFSLKDVGLPFFEPLYDLVRTYIALPEVVAFCLIFIGFVILTFVATISYKLISLKFTKAVIVKTKGLIFDKLKENDYRYFVDNKQGDLLYNVITSPQKIRTFLNNSTQIFGDFVIIATALLTLFFKIGRASCRERV